MNILAKLSKLIFNIRNKAWTDEQVAEFYKGLETPTDLSMRLSIDGYKWSGEYYLLDWNRTPNEALATKNMNCGDFSMLFVHLYELKHMNWEGNYMEDWTNILDPRYHYITFFNLDGQLYLQSNLGIQRAGSVKEVLDFYRAKGYKTIDKF